MQENRIAQPDYKSAYGYILDNIQKEDFIISVSNGAIPSYYVGIPDFCSRVFSFYNLDDSSFDNYRDWASTSLDLWTYKKNGSIYDIYNSCRIIRDYNEFRSIFSNSKGNFWFVVEKTGYLDPEMQNIVYSDCDKKDFRQIKVYYCPNRLF